MDKLWNIIILTMKGREDDFKYIYNKINQQISDDNLLDKVGIIVEDGDGTEGFKRNKGIARSNSLFSNFLDDDDDVHPKYVSINVNNLNENIDCIGFKGVVNFTNAKNPGFTWRPFEQSLRYNKYTIIDGAYCRPPTHLNPILTEMFRRYRFLDTNDAVDVTQAMNMLNNQALSREKFIGDEIMYVYNYDSTKNTNK